MDKLVKKDIDAKPSRTSVLIKEHNRQVCAMRRAVGASCHDLDM